MKSYSQDFFYISGRGWVTTDSERCSKCGHYTGRDTERAVLSSEYFGIIKPYLKEHPGSEKVTMSWVAEDGGTYVTG